jgi:hypothetical protein
LQLADAFWIWIYDSKHGDRLEKIKETSEVVVNSATPKIPSAMFVGDGEK